MDPKPAGINAFTGDVCTCACHTTPRGVYHVGPCCSPPSDPDDFDAIFDAIEAHLANQPHGDSREVRRRLVSDLDED